MAKTYSVAIQNKNGDWFTNWGQYFSLDEINFSDVEKYCIESKAKAYGYYYGNKSRNLTSSKCRTVIKIMNGEK